MKLYCLMSHTWAIENWHKLMVQRSREPIYRAKRGSRSKSNWLVPVGTNKDSEGYGSPTCDDPSIMRAKRANAKPGHGQEKGGL